MTQAERDRVILDYTLAVYAQPGITPEVAASQIAQAMDQFGVTPQEFSGAFQRDTATATPEQRAVFGDVGTVQQAYEAVRPTGQYSSSFVGPPSGLAPIPVVRPSNIVISPPVTSVDPDANSIVINAPTSTVSPEVPTREEVIRNYVDALYKTPGITSEEASLNLSQKMDEVGVSPQEFASAFANTGMFTPEQRDVFGNVDLVQTVYNQYNPTGLYSTLSRDTGAGAGTDTVTGAGTDTVTGGGYVGLVSESTAGLPYGGGFYKRTPEEQAMYEQEYRAIPVRTTTPTPVIPTTTGISRAMAPFVAPGGPGEEAGYARIREILASGEYTPEQIREGQRTLGVTDQDIGVATGAIAQPIRMPTPTLPGATAGTTQSIDEFIRSKAPTATPPITPSMFSPENVRNQLELERLRSGFTPKNRLTDLYGSFLGTQGDINRVIQENKITPDQLKTMYGVGDPEIEVVRKLGINPYTEPTPVAGFAQGGLVSDDINRMLQNQRNAIQRESQSRQMLTNMGAPPVKKFSNGGPAGSSSGVRRLKMSGYQEGGEVSKERPYEELHPLIQEQLEERRDRSRMISGGRAAFLKDSDTTSSTAQGLVNPQLLVDPRTTAEGYVAQSGVLADEYANRALPDEIFVNKNVGDRALLLSHEANHILARKQLGFPSALNQKFDELVEKRGAREKFVKDASEAYPYLREKYGLNAIYFNPKMLEQQAKAGKLPLLLYEQLASLAAVEDTQGVDLTKDPVLRKTLFKDRNVRETYSALTGLRMTRLDARDLSPMTRVPEKGSEKEAGLTDRIKKMLGFSEGGDVSNDDFIQEMMVGTRPTDETTSPGILPRELREAIDVPLDLANLAIRGTVGAVAGPAYGLYKGVTSEDFGTKKGVKEARSEAERMMGEITGEPKTQAAKDIMQSLGETMEEAKIPPMPQFLTTPAPGPGAAAALMRSYEMVETPPLGTVKLAGDKGVKPATPPTDQMGFYSPAEKAVMGLPQDKGTASQMLAQITKTQGVKPVELRATGLDEFLKSKGDAPVTKQEIQDFLTSNRVAVDEVVLGRGQTLSPEAKKLSGEALSRMEEVDNKLASYFEGVEEVAGQDPYSAFIMLRSSIGRRAAKGDQEALDELNAFNLPPEIKDLVLEFGRNKNEYIKYTSQARKMVKPKFDKYNILGGQNAREIYLTLPGEQMPSSLPPSVNAQGVLVKPMYATQPKFTAPSPHSVSPEADANRLAHIFLDERKDAKGNNVLFVQEMQSDWAQIGKKKGFRTPPDPTALEAAKTKISQAEQALRQKSEELFNRGERVQDHPERQVALEQVVQAKNELETLMQNSRLPPAPFVTNTEDWVNLALKRVIKEAVDNDIDTVAFIKGEQAADKYNLSKQVDKISYFPSTKTVVAYKEGNSVVEKRVTDPKELEGVIGKEAANKLLEQPTEKIVNARGDEVRSLSGVDLKLGGEGMKGFYDNILPKTANKLLKRLGGDKVEPVQLEFGELQFGAGAGRYSTVKENYLGFKITPEMKEMVKTEGLPKFAAGGEVTDFIKRAA